MAKISDICTAERLAQLQKATQCIEGGPQTPRTKIQRVPNYLRENPEFAKYYSPRLLSMGPIHHGRENLKLGEQYKLLWTAMYLKEIKKDPEALCQRIEDHIEELKGLYTENVIGDYNDKDLVWVFFVDGCSLLEFMEKFDFVHPEELWVKPDQQEHVVRDLHLLENQIPNRVLELLSKDEATLLSSMFNLASGGLVKSDIFQEALVQISGGESLAKILERLSKILPMSVGTINKFLKNSVGISKNFGGTMALPDPLEDPSLELEGKPKPNHLLDFVRLMLLAIDHDTEKDQRKQEVQIQFDDDDHKHNKEVPRLVWPTHKNIRELKAAGIRVEREETLCWSKISFSSNWFSGELKLPWFCVDESTPYIYLNMIAYEMCPDFQNNYEISSYLAFLDSLIEDANDVKELRSAGVIQNLLGSDEEVVKLFNGIGTELATKGFYVLSFGKMAYSKKCIQVKYEIEKHCRNKWKTWMAQAYNTYFRNPWSICAFLAAVLALVLTVIQTWFTIHPND